MGTVPKNYKCSLCDTETYSYYEKCNQCNLTGTVEPIDRTDEDKELRQKLHNTIDVMTSYQVKTLYSKLKGEYLSG